MTHFCPDCRRRMHGYEPCVCSPDPLPAIAPKLSRLEALLSLLVLP